jgi:two-component system sensor histidine kinase TctE
LAVLRTQAEYGMRQQDPAAMHAIFADLHHTTEQTSHLINQLLALARAEPNAAAGQATTDFDLGELSRATAIEWVPVARQKHTDLGFEAPDAAVTMRGDRLLVHELIANLIDNAIRYSPASARVTVRVAREEPDVDAPVARDVNLDAGARQGREDREGGVLLGADEEGATGGHRTGVGLGAGS